MVDVQRRVKRGPYGQRPVTVGDHARNGTADGEQARLSMGDDPREVVDPERAEIRERRGRGGLEVLHAQPPRLRSLDRGDPGAGQ